MTDPVLAVWLRPSKGRISYEPKTIVEIVGDRVICTYGSNNQKERRAIAYFLEWVRKVKAKLVHDPKNCLNMQMKPSPMLIRLFKAFNPGASDENAIAYLNSFTMEGSRWFLLEKEVNAIISEKISEQTTPKHKTAEYKDYYYCLEKKTIPLGGIMTAAIWNCSLCGGGISGMDGPGYPDQICGSCGDRIVSDDLFDLKKIGE